MVPQFFHFFSLRHSPVYYAFLGTPSSFESSAAPSSCIFLDLRFLSDLPVGLFFFFLRLSGRAILVPNGGTPCRGTLAVLASLGLASTLKSA